MKVNPGSIDRFLGGPKASNVPIKKFTGGKGGPKPKHAMGGKGNLPPGLKNAIIRKSGGGKSSQPVGGMTPIGRKTKKIQARGTKWYGK